MSTTQAYLLPRMLWRLLAVLALVGVSFGGLTVANAPQAAAAVTCYGDYCSGKDPQQTGCSNDAYTVAAAQIYVLYTGKQTQDYAGYLELRWSPTCKTNWARFSPQRGLSTTLRAIQPSTGYTQSYNPPDWMVSWTNMIYSPTRCVYAEVRFWFPLSYSGSGKTACI